MTSRSANLPRRRQHSLLFCGLLLAGAGVDLHAQQFLANDPLTQADASGQVRTFTPSGAIDGTNAFFQSLGSNGRSCNSCHRVEDAWSISPSDLQLRFLRSGGTDPVFRTVDGSNSPNANVSTLNAKRAAYSMLLNKGLIRIGIAVPATAEFTLDMLEQAGNALQAAHEQGLVHREQSGHHPLDVAVEDGDGLAEGFTFFDVRDDVVEHRVRRADRQRRPAQPGQRDGF